MPSLPMRYDLRSPLGRGGMGEVFLVFDREREQEVALKRLSPREPSLHQNDEEARFLFRQEFAAMATLRHPHLVEAYDYATDSEGVPYFTMEAVPGADLATDKKNTEAEVRRWLPAILSALNYLHTRSYLHSDLKPENIRIRTDGVPKLMDLGLLSRPGRMGAIRGSLHYVAPELARGHAVDARADLYALGAVLYHALAGRPPFDPSFQATPVDLLRAHLTEAPPPLAAWAPELSAEMIELIKRLLAKDPQERFTSASAVLTALGLASEGEAPTTLFEPPLLGRENQLQELRQASSGPSSTVLTLVGGPGAGKSALIAEWRAESQLQGLKTFSARGLGPDAPPYQALKPWLLALTAESCSELERLAPVLVRLLPDLGVDPAPSLEGAQERVRLHSAVAELAAAVAPTAAWILDDADELDSASESLVSFLRARGEACAWHWTISRKEETADSGRKLILPPFRDDETVAMTQAMLGEAPVPPALAEVLPILSGGNPGMLRTLLNHWVGQGVLTHPSSGWHVTDPARLSLPKDLTVVLDERFTTLSATAQRLGCLAALLGATGSLSHLAAIADLKEVDFFEALAELEASETLERTDGKFQFKRPAQAQTLAATWPSEEARRLHTQAAALFIKQNSLRPDNSTAALDDMLLVARHLILGDTPQDSLPWTFAAARQARVMYALGGVASLLEKSLSLPDLSVEARANLYDFQVTLFRAQGQIDEAVKLQETYVMPVARKGEPEPLAHQLTNLGILHNLKGRYREGLECLSEAITLADAANVTATRVRARLYAGRAAYFSGQSKMACTVLSAAVRIGREAEGYTLLGSALSLYGYVLATNYKERAAEGVALLEEAIAYNTAVDNGENLLEAYNNLGNLLLNMGRLKEARPTFERCLALSERIAMHNEKVFALINLGAVSLEMGKAKDALGFALQAAELSRTQGRKFPEAYALALEGVARIFMGELSQGCDRLNTALRIAVEINNRYLELNIYGRRLEAWLHLGRFTEAREELSKARKQAESAQNHELDEKFERLEATLNGISGTVSGPARLESLLTAPGAREHRPAFAQSLYWQAEQLHRSGKNKAALELLEQASQTAREEDLPGLEAMILCLWGRITITTSPALAAEKFLQGRALAEASGLVVIDIVCQAGLGQASPGAREERQEAPRRLIALLADCDDTDKAAYLSWPERAAILSAPLPSHPSATVARLHHLTDMIAAITTQVELPEVMQQALISLVAIAGAERGFLLLYNGFEVTQQIFHGMEARDNDEFSSSLAHQVLWSGEPVFIEDASSDVQFASRDSIQALKLRSVVAVPLHDGEETLGVMMADSQSINTQFGADDMDLVLALARQVAISISHSRRLERYRNAHEENVVLYRLGLQMMKADSLEAAFAAVAAEAIPLCAVSRALLLEGPNSRVCLAVHADGRPVQATEQDLSLSVAQWVYQEGQPLYLVDAQADENFQTRASIMALGLHSIYAVPVRVAEEVWGVLYLDHPSVLDENPLAAHTLGRIAEMLGALIERVQPGRLSLSSSQGP